jgi:alpha-amylase
LADAIWISPVIVNTPGGYHGYWAADLYSINPNFGTADDLRSLVDA